MGKQEQQKWEQDYKELEEEEEEAPSLNVRKSRTRSIEEEEEEDTCTATHQATSTTTVTTTTQFNSNGGNCKTNGHINIIQPPSNSPTQSGVDAEGPDNNAALSDDGFHKETQILGAHSRSDSCVYYDKDEGMWKCRICSWTYGTACVTVDLIQNPKGPLYELMIHKTLNQREPCFTFELEGSKSNSTFCGDEHIEGNPDDGKYDTREGNSGVQKSFDSLIDCQVEGNKKDRSNLPSLQYSPILSKECGGTFKAGEIKEIENKDIDLISESGLEVTEIDVERVLEKQNTHDLYCPNCNSCVTRRVILRKRKRRVRITSEDVKSNKLETEFESSFTYSSGQGRLENSIQVHATAEIPLDVTSQPAVEEYEREREPDIFRCLSCFSFFIPTGNGFKLFRFFGDKAEKKPAEDEQKIMSKSWISSIFASDRERTSEPGSVTRSEALETNSGTSSLASHVNGQDGQSFSMLKDLSIIHGKGLVRSGIAESQEDGDKISTSSKELFINGKEGLIAGDNSNNTIENKDTGDAAKDHFEVATSIQPNTSNTSVNIVAYHQSDSSKAAHMDKIPVIIGESTVTGSQPNSTNISINVAAYGQSDPVKVPSHKNAVTDGVSPEDTVLGNQPDGLKLQISSPGGSPVSEKSRIDQDPNLTTQNTSADKESTLSLPTEVLPLKEPPVNSATNISVDIPRENGLGVGVMILNKFTGEKNATFKWSNYDGAYPTENSEQTICEIKEEIHTGELFKINKDPVVFSVKDISLSQEIPATIAKDLRKVAAEFSSGKDTVIVVESENITTAASQRAQDLSVSEGTRTSANLATHISVTEPTEADARQAYQIDIIKSIVYGGLVESITSLGVVSSAAGGDTSTVNILALGLANVVGGLILIGHNLWNLKKEQVTEQIDRYKEKLGSRENFLLHSIIVILSFLVFGLIPPITYGFSFRKSGNKELKLLAVAAASLVCILVLTIGKEYVRRPPKSYVKTIAYYVLLGFMVTGISYAVGELIRRLLEKLHFQSNSSVFLTLPEMTPAAAEWAAY